MKISFPFDPRRILSIACLVGSASWASCGLAAAIAPAEGQVATLRKQATPTRPTPIVDQPEPLSSTNAPSPVTAIEAAPIASPTIVPAIPVVTLQLLPKQGLLSKALGAFATQHGWTVSWELERDFPIDFPARFEGTFLNVIEQVAMTLQSSETPIRVKAYHGNNVLRVMAATQ